MKGDGERGREIPQRYQGTERNIETKRDRETKISSGLCLVFMENLHTN